MKKLYSIFILAYVLLVSQVLRAQSPYHKMIASNYTDWYIFQDMIAVKPAGGTVVNTFNLEQGKYTAMTDTLVLGNTYKKMIHVYYSPGFFQNLLIGFIREDTVARKVYFLEKNVTTEVTLYDFSLMQGSVTNLNFPNNFGQFPAGNYTVVTVDSVMTRVGYRTQLKLLASSGDTLVHIESIGSIIHPLYLYQSDYGYGQFMFGGSSTCSYPYSLGLACKESNNQKLYQSCTYDLALMNSCIYEYDSCNYYNSCSGLNELSKDVKVNLSPNPASDKTTLEIDMATDEITTIDMYDITGRNIETIYNGTLTTGKHTIQIALNNYNNGYYLIKIIGKSFIVNRSVIISR